MKNALNTVQGSAYHALFAGALGILLFYIRNSWVGANAFSGFFFEMVFIFVFYIYMPLVFSTLYMVTVGYVTDLVNGLAEPSLFCMVLLALALATAGYTIIGLSEGVVLIVSGLVFLIRLFLKLYA